MRRSSVFFCWVFFCSVCCWVVLATCCLLCSPAAYGAEEEPKGRPLIWSDSVHSPHTATPSGRDADLYEVCGGRDLGLTRVAAEVVNRRIQGLAPPTEAQLKTLLRAAGVPQLWPRAWALRGTVDEAELKKRLAEWLDKQAPEGQRRCGIARGVDGEGQPVVAAVVVDAIADLEPLPIRTAVSRWLSLEAKMHLPTDQVKVVLLGPRGRPKRVLTSTSQGRVRSRFTLDQPGAWTVQVVAMTADGPRPTLEATLFAGVDPPEVLEEPDPAAAEPDPHPGQLARRLNEARRAEGMKPLSRDDGLDKLARAHAAAMMRARRVAHDVGQGSPDERARAGGIHQRVGENVASAPTVSRIHHALWDSPSHRENMLDASFQRFGVALAIDRTGQLYAVQMFAE